VWTPPHRTYYITENIIANVDEPTINVIDELQKEYENEDIKAVLSIDNTDYNSLVMQSSDNKYYLYRNAYKKNDGLGTPFVDYRIDLNNTKKTLIFGHNSKYKEMPFKILENYYEEDYYKEHNTLTLTLKDSTKKYEIFSVYVEYEDFDYYKLDFKNNNEWFSHITKLKNKSFYDTGVDINKDDEIIILQTCSTLNKYSKYKHKFLVIVGKLVS
jgi:sortase B